MPTKIVEASTFRVADEYIRNALLQSNVLPINDLLIPLWGNKNAINILFGSYGSGKSIFIVDELIEHALYDPYFRCFFGRKILGKVRESVFKTITDRIKDRYLTHLFSFSDSPNGSMDIRHRINGNEFHPFGCDKPESMKSVKDPSHIFCEELDQFSFTDFGLLYSRLRKEGVVLQFYGAFNTEKVYKSHWIRRVLLDGMYSDQCVSTKINYYDNYFIDQDAYYKKLELIANGNMATLNAIARGEWGVIRSGDELWKQFDESKHVGKNTYTRSEPIWVTLDQNVVPYVTCLVWQSVDKILKQIKELLCESPDNNAEKAAHKLCNYLDAIDHNESVIMCGDPSGSSRNVIDPNNSSFYVKFREVVQRRGYVCHNRVMKAAPQVSLSVDFVNAIYEHRIGGYTISIDEFCFQSIEDYLMVKQDPSGKMIKDEVKDEETGHKYQPRGHISDAKRYFILTILAALWNDYKGRRTNKSDLSKALSAAR